MQIILKEYSEDFLKFSIDIDKEFSKNSKISGDEKFRKEILSAKDESELASIMKNAGVINSLAIIELIKSRIEMQNNFRVENPDFYLLASPERNELFYQQFDLVLDKHFPNLSKYPTTSMISCGSDYNRSISRCNRTFYRCSSAAILVAAGGFFPGLVAAVFCMWEITDCRSDANEDFADCKSEEN